MTKKSLVVFISAIFLMANLLGTFTVLAQESDTLLDWQKGWDARQVHNAVTELNVTPGTGGSVKITTEAGKTGGIGLEQTSDSIPFTIDGFKMKFKYKITNVTAPELRVIFLPEAKWYTENPVAFGLLIHYRENNKAAFGPLTKKPDQGDAAHSPQEWAGDFTFYHDGSQENIFEIKFDSGKPFFYINGTKLEGYTDFINAPSFLGEGSTKSILDYYPEGKAYVQFFQTSPDNNATIEITGIGDENEAVETPTTSDNTAVIEEKSTEESSQSTSNPKTGDAGMVLFLVTAGISGLAMKFGCKKA